MADRDPHGAERWTEPTVECWVGTDCLARHQWLVAHGELLVTWPAAPFEETVTDCFRVGEEYWIWQLGVGGIRFFENQPHFAAFPAPEGDRSWFDQVVSRSWLPAVYQFWGRQVLHATAVSRHATGGVFAFTGPSHAGKSTMAYGLGQRTGWALMCDDTLAFSSEQGRIALHRMQNEARLREATAAYYGKTSAVAEPINWPAHPLRLTAVYVLDGDPNRLEPPTITRLGAAESYPLLLEQAHSLTLKLPKHTRQLMRDYLDLASAAPVFRFAYRKSFEVMEDTLDAMEQHARSIDTWPEPVELADTRS